MKDNPVEVRKSWGNSWGNGKSSTVFTPNTAKHAKKRTEIERHTAEFLAAGGEITQCETGMSNFKATVQIVINHEATERLKKR